MAAALDIATLEACFAAAPDPISIVDRDGRVLYANPASERAWRAPGRGLAGRTLREIDLSAHALGAIEDACRAVIADGEPRAIEVEGPPGRVRRHRLSAVRGGDGSIAAITVISGEVGDAGDAAEPGIDARARSSAHEQMQRLLDGAPVLVAIMRGEDHVYEFVNDRFARTFPATSRLVGTSARAHRADLVQQHLVELLDHVYQSGDPYEAPEVPLVVEGEDGPESIYLTFVYQPILDAGGAACGIASFAFDVTESVLARKQIEEASRAKDEFLSTLSHELRTPLNAIVGWSHLLRTGALDTIQSQRALEAIDRNARVQKRLIDDLLDFARMVSGKLGLQASAVDLVGVIGGAVEAIRPSVGAKSVELTLDVAERPTIVGDADRLQQVMWNLLSNAVKFTGPRGHVSIHVGTREGHAEIVVRDDGLGIDAHFLPHIFERFRQADSTSTRRHGGLGLGLAIARSIVEMHGGSIEAESEGLGKGTTMRVRLPLREGDRVSAPVPPEVRRLPTDASRLRGVRVLVVDDEQDARALADTVLRQSGARVRLASCASEALDALHHEEFDVLVSDVGMPELDGITLIERVRALPGPTSRIPAIAVTAYARTEDRDRVVGAGYDAFLSKPIEVDQLGALVAHVVGRAGDPHP